MLSAKTDVKTKVEGLNLGADAYIEKPFAIEQLKAQLYSIRERCERMRKLFAENPLEYYRHAPKEDVHDKEAAEFISNLNAYILDHYTEKDFSIDNLARHFYMSRSNFHKKVKAITGNTPNDYIRIIRLNRSLELLSSGKYQIMEVCYMVGFNTPSYFSKCFSEHFGKLPNEYLKG
jgi:AraC-like DNA-binding protein